MPSCQPLPSWAARHPSSSPKPLQLFLEQQVVWLNLEALSQEPDLDPLLNLLTLPVRPERELAASSQQILASRPDPVLTNR